MDSRENDFEFDIESGGTTSEEEASKDLGSSKRQVKKILKKVSSGILNFNGAITHERGISSSSNLVKSGGVVDVGVELLIDKSSEEEESRDQVFVVEKMRIGEKHKKNSRKPPKPPRPPKGPSLDAADRKLVRELTDVAMRKRARIERIKALKKVKAGKGSSLNSGLSAMVITLVFFLVITFQGLSSRSSITVGLPGSPEPAVATSESLISVQFYKDPFAFNSNGSSSGSSSFAEEQQAAG